MHGQLDVDKVEKMIKYMGLVGAQNKDFETDPEILADRRQRRLNAVEEAELNQFYREVFPSTFTESIDVYLE